MEEWLNIDGYPDYQVSNTGKVKSIKYGKERILKQGTNKYGYHLVQLYRDGKYKNMKVHRLVAEAFISNPDNLPQINHKDENPLNNNVENLEFCDAKYNINYGTHNKRMAKTKTGIYNTKISKAVKCLETSVVYPSLAEIQRKIGFSKQNISACCNGKRKSAYKFHWEWV